MKVLVLWADRVSANMGVRVLAAGMADLARQAWGDSIQVDYQDFGPGESDIAFAGRALLKDIVRRGGPVRSRLRQYDVILDSGAGDSFTDIYGLKRLSYIAYVHAVASSLKKTIVLGPQTIGPFNSVGGRFLARNSLRRVASLQARDTVSARYASEIGRNVDAVGTDVVFCLPKETHTASRDVVINVSGLLWAANSHVSAQRYRDAVRRVIHTLLAEGREVTLLAHVIDNPSPDNDVPAIHELAAEFRGRVEPIIPSTLQEVRSVVGSASVVVGARMHSCLNALSVGTPAVAMSYSRKFAPLMDDLGWDHVVSIDGSHDLASEVLREINALSDLGEIHDLLLQLRSRAKQRIGRSVAALKRIEV